MKTEKTESDLLYSVPEIAKYLGMTPPQVYHLTDPKKHPGDKRLPTFRIGRKIAARKSTLTKWLADKEAAAGGAPV